MTITEAIVTLEKWYAGGYATRIEDMNPAVKLGIEALNLIDNARKGNLVSFSQLLPGETEE